MSKTIDQTYNIHKKINCVFPKFKSKMMCKAGKHNYRVYSTTKDEDRVPYWKCYCCGNTEEFEEY